MRAETSIIVVDAHGETTSEKIAIGRYLDGRVSAVLGTHTHVQTADEQIFEKGTAFICDAGMCGPVHSILGRDIETIVGRFISNLPAPFPIAQGETRLRGVLVEVDETTGRALSISGGSTNRVRQRSRLRPRFAIGSPASTCRKKLLRPKCPSVRIIRNATL